MKAGVGRVLWDILCCAGTEVGWGARGFAHSCLFVPFHVAFKKEIDTNSRPQLSQRNWVATIPCLCTLAMSDLEAFGQHGPCTLLAGGGVMLQGGQWAGIWALRCSCEVGGCLGQGLNDLGLCKKLKTTLDNLNCLEIQSTRFNMWSCIACLRGEAWGSGCSWLSWYIT